MADEVRKRRARRLRREGRWEEFKARQKKLYSTPGKRSEAAEKALDDEFGSPEDEFKPRAVPAAKQEGEAIPPEKVDIDGGDDDSEGVELPDIPEIKSSAQLVEAAMWVFHNVDRPLAEREGNPPSGAMGLMSWAKKDPAQFYTRMISKFMDKVSKDKKVGGPVEDDGRKLTGIAANLVDEFKRRRLKLRSA